MKSAGAEWMHGRNIKKIHYIHWGDCEETGDQDEGAQRCLREGDVGEVGSSRTCMGGTSRSYC